MNRIGLKKAMVFVAVIAFFGGLTLAADGTRGRRGGFGQGFGRRIAQEPNEAVPDRPMRNRGMGFGRGPRAGRTDESAATDEANVQGNRGRGYDQGRNREQQQNRGWATEQQAGPRQSARPGRGQGLSRGRNIQGPGRNLRQFAPEQGTRIGRRQGLGRNAENRQGPNKGQHLYGGRRGRGGSNAGTDKPGLMRERGGKVRWYTYEYWRKAPERILGQRRGGRQNLRTTGEKTDQEQTTRPHRSLREMRRFWEE